ncbi:LysR family transcriptional regulator [Thermobifida fusca]|jgi:DNA-binding transcriptional LysR family regulator|uniref:LysR family transcriptional regulator n=2 Tax=Thermobifida fusca TaxID=2021 RepID=A0A9P2WQY6_THEFU|nr:MULTISPECIES: LysR substrate-binding domain-containing protein [Thermobifida]AAZ55461.1 transcriptional regulator, LysR family [Thermobifida fusca YX]EOR71494.1 LysR family transcriptional regulator [Thermobifida fusca TM51]MBO2530873.1 LysR family transcriptional regulator [Thermobifida sp.]MDD6791798.1 LysR substrate-binding domain-containing protein [Thermobifida fusca]PPS91922.1 LysR family transcriptional regulator [Thermobifida fusca]
MDLTRLRLLVELRRLGTMTAVSEVTGMGTSAVSKHLAVLEREAGVRLLVPDGRRVRLTPAGRRLAEHARDILERVEAARAEMAGEGPPVGRINLVTFVSMTVPVILPAMEQLRQQHPGLEVRLIEHEPDQALDLLLSGEADLGLIYEYTLVPRRIPEGLTVHPVGREPLFLAEPTASNPSGATMTRERLRALADASWIANSRGSDDDELVLRMCADAGFRPQIRHRIDTLEALSAVVAAGWGVGLLPKLAASPPHPGVVHTPLGELAGERRISLVARTGAWAWRPLHVVAHAIHRAARHVLDPVASGFSEGAAADGSGAEDEPARGDSDPVRGFPHRGE